MIYFLLQKSRILSDIYEENNRHSVGNDSFDLIINLLLLYGIYKVAKLTYAVYKKRFPKGIKYTIDNFLMNFQFHRDKEFGRQAEYALNDLVQNGLQSYQNSSYLSYSEKRDIVSNVLSRYNKACYPYIAEKLNFHFNNTILTVRSGFYSDYIHLLDTTDKVFLVDDLLKYTEEKINEMNEFERKS